MFWIADEIVWVSMWERLEDSRKRRVPEGRQPEAAAGGWSRRMLARLLGQGPAPIQQDRNSANSPRPARMRFAAPGAKDTPGVRRLAR